MSKKIIFCLIALVFAANTGIAGVSGNKAKRKDANTSTKIYGDEIHHGDKTVLDAHTLVKGSSADSTNGGDAGGGTTDDIPEGGNGNGAGEAGDVSPGGNGGGTGGETGDGGNTPLVITP